MNIRTLATLVVGVVCSVFVFFTFSSYLRKKESKTLAPVENRSVEYVVLQDLIFGHTDEMAKRYYGAYFLDGPGMDIVDFKQLFGNLGPRIELGTNNADFTTGGLVDKVSKKPAKLFWANTTFSSDGGADVDAGWYTGPEGSVSFQYRLKKDGSKWKIVSRLLVW